MRARRLLGITCIVTFWGTGHFLGEFYPFSPLGMFNQSTTSASRLFVRDAAGKAREIGRYEAWRCDGRLDFHPAAASTCPAVGFSAYDDIVRDWIVAHPAAADDAADREALEITRRVFRIADPTGPVDVTDCPLLRCTARRSSSSWIPRL